MKPLPLHWPPWNGQWARTNRPVMHRQELLNLLDQYHTAFLNEAGYVARMKRYIEAESDCFHSQNVHGHVTGSAWVVNPSRDRVLMLHHKKQNQWFQPGGHADRDHDILRVALREVHEETGIATSDIKLLSPQIFDIDIHTIPGTQKFPRHQHFDVRFLLEIDDRIEVPGNDESHDIRWLSLHEAPRYNSNLSTHRMVEKTRRLRNPVQLTKVLSQ